MKVFALGLSLMIALAVALRMAGIQTDIPEVDRSVTVLMHSLGLN